MRQALFEIPRDDEPLREILRRAQATGRLLLVKRAHLLIAPRPLPGWQVAGVCTINHRKGTPCCIS